MGTDEHDVRVLLRHGVGPADSEPDLAAIDRRRRQLSWRRRLAGGVAALLVLPLLGVAAAGFAVGAARRPGRHTGGPT